MRTDTAKPVRLADYRVPDYLIDRVDLDVRLDGSATRVVSRLAIRPNPAGVAGAPLALDGDGLVARCVEIDGVPLPGWQDLARPDGLVIAEPPRRAFTLTVETRARPGGQHPAHGALSLGLGLLHAMRGRRLSPHHLFSRPARRAVGLYDAHRGRTRGSAGAARQRQPDRRRRASTGTTRHFAVWHDPHPKPCYLFALVGGDLGAVARPVRHGVGPQGRSRASMSSTARKSAPPMRWMR